MEDKINKQEFIEENSDVSKEEQSDVVIPEPGQLSYGSMSKLARILIDIARTSSQKKEDPATGSNEDN